ncbi:MAG: hypothetical protein ABI843_12310 [Dokdonella sp.]
MPEESRGTGRSETAEAVLAYLRKRPDAADTLEGIVEWWLPRQRYETECSRIRAALAELVGAGALRCDRLPGGGDLYALNDPTQTSPPN